MIQTWFQSASHTTAICHSRVTGQHYTRQGASDQGLSSGLTSNGSDSAAGNTQTKGSPYCKADDFPSPRNSSNTDLRVHWHPPTHTPPPFPFVPLVEEKLLFRHCSTAGPSCTRSTRYHCAGKGWEDALLAAASPQLNSAAWNCTTHCEILVLLKHKAARSTFVSPCRVIQRKRKTVTKKTWSKDGTDCHSAQEKGQLQRGGLPLPSGTTAHIRNALTERGPGPGIWDALSAGATLRALGDV